VKTGKSITVIGTGYVGLTTATLLAHAGYKVFALDINQERLSTIKAGRSFFFEHGLNPLLAEAVKKKLLIPTDSYADSVPKSSFVFSCVGTPDNPDGSSNLTYVFKAAKTALKHMSVGAVYVQKSTVPVGTGKRVQEIFAKSDKRVCYVSNPEFLREGTALSDSLFFDRVVVGSDDKPAARSVLDLYRAIEDHRNSIAHLAEIEVQEKQGNYIETTLNSAELIKVTANAFLALKISFANSIAKLADHTGANITEVMDAVGADHRIGRAFLNAGRGYGGGCFPKDVSGLISSASEHGVDLSIMTAAADLNETMPGYIANKLQEKLGDLKGKHIAVLGLAFKSGTSDARRSPGVKLANILSPAGARVTTYDPEANNEAEAELRKGVLVSKSVLEATKDSDTVCVATDWPEFLSQDLGELAKHMNGTTFVDCMNVYDISQVRDAGLQYIGVGRNGDL
jgi:UDPglucose 6-dehydrogenase